MSKAGGCHQPLKALILGLLVSVVVAIAVSALKGIVISIMFNASLSDGSDVKSILSENVIYLVIDLTIMSIILFLAGRVVRKYTDKKTATFGVYLSTLTLIVFVTLALLSNAFSVYPDWYNILLILIVYFAVYLGTKPNILSRG